VRALDELLKKGDEKNRLSFIARVLDPRLSDGFGKIHDDFTVFSGYASMTHEP
jgi:hypothetical protein